MNCQLNNEKVWSIKGKTTKSSITFRRNKPNFEKAQMNINIYYIKDYQIFIPLAGQKNKPNSNPISSKAKMNLKSLAGKSGHTLSERIFAKYLNLGTIVQ